MNERLEKTVRTGATILKFVSGSDNPVRVKEVAAFAGVSYSTAMRHLLTFADHGFVKKVGKGFEIGFAAAKLWAKHLHVLKENANV